MKLLSRKKKANTDEGIAEDEKVLQVKSEKKITKGVPRSADFIANSIDRSNSGYIKVGQNYAKTLLVTGYPREVEIGWLDALFDHQGDIDRIIHVDPYDDRQALDELTRIYTRLETEESFVYKSGDNSMIQEIATAKQDAWAIRELVATNRSRFYGVSVQANIYNKNLEKLEEEGAMLEEALARRSIYTKWAEGRMDEGFLSVSPLGKNLCDDITRGFDSYALSTCFLFTKADLNHKWGVPIAINRFTGKFLNYDPRDLSLDNYNSAIFAGSGKGKSTLLKTIESRLQYVGKSKGKYKGEKTCFVDPMGEYVKMTERLDGVNLDIGPGSSIHLNPCDISEEYDKDAQEWSVNLGDKIANMTLLTSIFCGGLSDEEASLVDRSWKNVYTLPPFSFTEEPESLYEIKNVIDETTNQVEYGKVKKLMPRLRNAYAEFAKIPKLDRVKTIMERFLESNPALGFFDCYTNVELKGKRVYNFVTKRIEKTARVAGMFSVLSWIEDNFVKADPDEPGRVILEEAWIYLRSVAAPITMSFIESLYRRARHHNKGITIISQDFQIFTKHEQGMSIFQNSDTMFFLNNNEAEIKAIQEFFSFSDGILELIRNAGKGEGVMKVKDKFYAFQVENTPMEKEWVYSKKRVEEEDDDEEEVIA